MRETEGTDVQEKKKKRQSSGTQPFILYAASFRAVVLEENSEEKAGEKINSETRIVVPLPITKQIVSTFFRMGVVSGS